MTQENPNKETPFPATVVQVIDDFRIAINRGSNQGVRVGQRFLLFELSKEEIKDPESGKILGKLEIPKGTGEVIHVQDDMAVIKSDRNKPSKRTIIRREKNWINLLFTPEEETIIPSQELLPFQNPKKGDKAKPI